MDPESEGLRIRQVYLLHKGKTPWVWHKAAWCGSSAWALGDISLLPVIPVPLFPGMIVPVRVPSMSQIDLFENY